MLAGLILLIALFCLGLILFALNYEHGPKKK